MPGKMYKQSKRLEAVRLWLVVGNLRQTAAALDIPFDTVKTWRYSQWWDELARDIRAEGTIKLTNKLKTITEKALDTTLDRLENGDWFYDQKTGNLVRRPVSAITANTIAKDSIDRAVLLEKIPQQEENELKTQDKLNALAEAFKSFAAKTTRVEVIDAIPKEREEGLQEGTSVGITTRWREETEGQGGESTGSEDSSKGGDDLETLPEADRPQETYNLGRNECPV